MFNKIEFEVESSRRYIEYYNNIEDELEILIDSACSFKIDDKCMDVLKAFNNLIRALNCQIVDSTNVIGFVKELKDSYYEVKYGDKNIVLYYIEKWMNMIFRRIIQHDLDKIDIIISEYIVTKDRNGLIDFYLYVLHEYYKEYSLNWIDM